MHARQRRLLGLLLLAALAALGVAYRESFASIVQKWIDDSAYSHGFLILPISLWLAWRKRNALLEAEWQPSWLGVLMLLAGTGAWIVARGTGVLVIEQFAVVSMIPALVTAVLGWKATRSVLFSLAFLFLAVPFGRGIVPVLMHATADISTLALQWSRIPVFRSHMYISIPAGDFEVARACSGLNYSVTGLVLGLLYAFVSYQQWQKRLLCVAAFVVVPVLANGMRVYITILVSHLTDMRYGPGTEHITFGRIFFVIVMLLMFWIGRRWHDEVPAEAVAGGRQQPATHALPPLAWVPVPVALLIALVAPSYLEWSLTRAADGLADTGRLATLPTAAAGWRGPLEGVQGWSPLYEGGLVERQGAFILAEGPPVDVFVAAYGLGASTGREMIAYENVLTPRDRGSLSQERRRTVAQPEGGGFVVNELLLSQPGGSRLVWYWFMVGNRTATSGFMVKALEAMAFAAHAANSERIITLSTPADDDAEARLEAFVVAHSSCIRAGLVPEACGG